MSYHIDVDISNSEYPTEHYEGPYLHPGVAYGDTKPNKDFELTSQRLNADHKTYWCNNNTYWTTFWPAAGLGCKITKTKDFVYGGKEDPQARTP